MTIFFRLMDVDNKEDSLKSSIYKLSNAEVNKQTHNVNPEEFLTVPGAPFAYWVSTAVRKSFEQFESTESETRTARQGLATSDDFRFIRTSWEIATDGWPLFAKGGEFALYYSDVHLKVNWESEGAEIKALICQKYPYLNGGWAFVAKNTSFYLRAGLTWSRRTQKGLSMRALPSGCVFADKGPALFSEGDTQKDLLSLLAIVNSCAYKYLVDLQMCFGSFEVGVISRTPIPELSIQDISYLSDKALAIWELKRKVDATDETSHAFFLPMKLLNNEFLNFERVEMEINQLLNDIDSYCFQLFKFSSDDTSLAIEAHGRNDLSLSRTSEKEEQGGLISWCVGVVFGRFDQRLHNTTDFEFFEAKPFEPLTDLSPGMLNEANKQFHKHNGILVGEEGHQHNLSDLVSGVLESIEESCNVDLNKWLNKDFFALHLKQYSKSRRQAPIYWPLQTPSGSYTVWIYYPELNNQTLYSCVNDFVEPKLKIVIDDILTLRAKSARSTAEDNELSSLLDFEDELQNFKDELLRIAQFWKPNLDDGVQINSAPLWKLFQHKVWQKKLKKTWEELEQGKYDWSHFAYNSWPERVLKQCQQDRSIAIAHGVEADLWVEVEVMAANGKDIKMEWQPRELTSQDYSSFVQQQIARLKGS